MTTTATASDPDRIDLLLSPAEAAERIRKIRAGSFFVHVTMDIPTVAPEPDSKTFTGYTRRSCLKLTRKEVLRQLDDWARLDDKFADDGKDKGLVPISIQRWDSAGRRGTRCHVYLF